MTSQIPKSPAYRGTVARGIIQMPSDHDRDDLAKGAKAEGHPFRAPHYTAMAASMPQEVALAATGVLYLEDVDLFSREGLRTLLNLWAQMPLCSRPVIVVTRTPEPSSRITEALLAAAIRAARTDGNREGQLFFDLTEC